MGASLENLSRCRIATEDERLRKCSGVSGAGTYGRANSDWGHVRGFQATCLISAIADKARNILRTA